MAHRLVDDPLAGGDQVDVMFRIEQNTHKDFGGGLQLVLSDFRRTAQAMETAASAADGVSAATSG
jgi:hypothetical protein